MFLKSEKIERDIAEEVTSVQYIDLCAIYWVFFWELRPKTDVRQTDHRRA